ncbi:uncharacterized protein LOC115283928 [Suricata suricatta]|uniref:uncharacterized protein LOC115283928 n=1 Tax=Suricata suricatta TaxID=37032 RepID=UPI001155D6CD|nr:uncharacterized protein LOC115283928 [Suricata suricatta]
MQNPPVFCTPPLLTRLLLHTHRPGHAGRRGWWDAEDSRTLRTEPAVLETAVCRMDMPPMLYREGSLRPRPGPSWGTLHPESRGDKAGSQLPGPGRAPGSQRESQASGGCLEARAQLLLQKEATRPPVSFWSHPGLPAVGVQLQAGEWPSRGCSSRVPDPAPSLTRAPLLYCGLGTPGSRGLTRMLGNSERIGCPRGPAAEIQSPRPE